RMMVPNSSDRPRLLASQARPSPAARPPSGPSQRLPPAAAAPAAGCWRAACPAGGCAGALRCRTMSDCLPKERPPPMRRASASGTAITKAVTPAATIIRNRCQCFISCLRSVWGWGAARSECDALVQRDDARAEIEITDPGQAGVDHHRLQGFLVRMHAYGFGEIS